MVCTCALNSVLFYLEILQIKSIGKKYFEDTNNLLDSTGILLYLTFSIIEL